MKHLIKRIATAIVTLAYLFIGTTAFAQVPQKFNYQGIARDTKGNPMGKQQMTLKLTVLPTADATVAEYEETQSVTTNEFGLYTLQIGNGKIVTGDMKTVKWETGNKYIKVAIDPKGGTNFVDAGTSQLLSVPYAIYADKAGNMAGDDKGTRTGTVSTSAAGTGTVNYLAKFTAANTIYNSQIFDNGTAIGIGTTTPAASAKVHISSATGTQPMIFESPLGVHCLFREGGLNRGYFGSYIGSGGAYPTPAGTTNDDFDIGTSGSNPNGKLHLATQTTPRVTIDKIGRVGIGTTTPNVKLEVVGASLFQDSMTIGGDNGPKLRIGNYPIGGGLDPQLQLYRGNNFGMRIKTTVVGLTSFDYSNDGFQNNTTRLLIGGSGDNYIAPGINNVSSCGTPSLTWSNVHSNRFQTPNLVDNRKVVLWQSADNDHQFYGLGINADILRYQVNYTTSSHVFYAGVNATTSNELMRITGTGNVGIGVTNPTEKLMVGGSVDVTEDLFTGSGNGVFNAGGGNLNVNINMCADADNHVIVNGDEDLYVQDDFEVGGGAYKPGGGSWTTTSDARLKRDIAPFTDGLQKLLQINPVTYKYNNKIKLANPDKEYVGVIAQELKEVTPYMVEETPFFQKSHEDENGKIVIDEPGQNYYQVDNSAMTYILINAIKEQQNTIESLEKRVAAFEKR